VESDLAMATNVEWVRVEEEHVIPALKQAAEKLDTLQGELVLDFSSVRRLDPASLGALAALADKVDGAGTKVVLRGLNVDLYKVLKLTKLASRFTFRT
jgi:anti-anti-sigma regulatory factor